MRSSVGPEAEAMEDDDSCCEICGEAEPTLSNQIIFCDGCDIAVCQKCYSVTKVPDGDWYCRPCAAGARGKALVQDVSCVICERQGGALEPTTCSRWAHTACCHTIEEVFFVNLGEDQTFVNLSELSRERRSYKCSMCENPGGTIIMCSSITCRTAFHPMCALDRVKSDGLVKYVEYLPDGSSAVQICCAVHSRALGGKLPPRASNSRRATLRGQIAIPADDSDAVDNDAAHILAALAAARSSRGVVVPG